MIKDLMINFPKSYILHCKSLKERKIHMETFMLDFNINHEWVTDFDGVELTKEIIDEFYIQDDVKVHERIAPLWPISQHQSRRLFNTEISLAIKHYKALEKISENDEIGLVLEDDCLFCENFIGVFNEMLSKTPNDWDVIHVGNGYGMHPENYKKDCGNGCFLMKHPASRCTEAILFKKEAAKKIISNMKPILLAADWELAYQYYKLDLNVYWWDPAPITQASHRNYFKSSIR